MAEISFVVRLFVLVLLFLALPSTVVAQQHRGSPDRLAVDVVTLIDGRTLYGIAIEKTDQNGVKLFVERDWLKKNEPEMHRKSAQSERTATQKKIKQTIERLNRWIADRSAERDLVQFLESEKSRLQNSTVLDALVQNKFVLVELAAGEFRKTLIQQPEDRHLAGVAWKRNIQDVSVRTADSLRRELTRLGVDVDKETFDFSGQINVIDDSQEQWAARVALIEHAFRKPLEFYAHGDVLVQRGDAASPAALLGQMLGGARMNMLRDVARELGLRDFETDDNEAEQDQLNALRRQAIAHAEREGYRGFLMTKLNQNLGSPTVKVSGHFFARVADDKWKPIFHVDAVANVHQQPRERIERLKEDPQIKRTLELVEAWGLAGQQAAIDLALRHGAATQQALGQVNDRFHRFFSQYLNRVDGPALKITK